MLSSRIFAKFSWTLVVMGGMQVGCKGKAGSAESGGVAFPTRVPASASGDGDAVASTAVGRITAGDGQTLQIDLQRAPPLGTAALFACWDLPLGTQPIGLGVCVGDAGRRIEITAGHINFLCRTNADYGVFAAREPLPMDGCEAIDVFTYKFQPGLTLEIAGKK